ncbi:hypothetical protein ACWEKT_39875 [Nocardia takedensis]
MTQQYRFDRQAIAVRPSSIEATRRSGGRAACERIRIQVRVKFD